MVFDTGIMRSDNGLELPMYRRLFACLPHEAE